jgi:ribosomal protein S12 methylthiotransferase accessory factor
MTRDMLAKYARCGIHLFISDFTLDMGVPSVGVLAYDPGTFPQTSEIVWTAGTTPSPEKALSRALTEVAQLAGDFNTAANYVASGLPKFRRLEDAAPVTHPGAETDLASIPDISHANIRVEIENCVQALSRGVECCSSDHAPRAGDPRLHDHPRRAFSRTLALNVSACSRQTRRRKYAAAEPVGASAIDARLPGKHVQFRQMCA